MARKTFTFIPASQSTGLLPMDAIPDDVKEEAEQAYAAIRETEGRVRVEFDTADEAKLYCRQVASYCAQRTPPLKFRKSPTRNLPDTVVDYRVTADIEAGGKANEKAK